MSARARGAHRRVRYNHAMPLRCRLGVAALVLTVSALCVPAASLSRTAATPVKLGKSEGALSLLALPGYVEKPWLTPFVRQTGCKVTVKYASAFDDISTLMRGGGTGVDLVTAAGDVGLTLVEDGDVAPIDVKLIPAWKGFHAAFRSPATNTVKGRHYGISALFSPNLLAYNPKRIAQPPRSWSAVYSPKHAGKITVPDDPMFIADAALYLSKTRPGLGIRDPFELGDAQFAAVVALLRTQRPLVAQYWQTASDEIQLFKSGGATIGSAWPYQQAALRKTAAALKTAVPREGLTGWLDSWMLSVKAKHRNCAYRWLNYISTPKVQARLATFYGATPVTDGACAPMDALEPGSCARYRANAPEAYYRRITLWKSPVGNCGVPGGTRRCVPYSKWAQSWAEIKQG